MKTVKTYSLDIEVVERLKEVKNASELINNLLLRYFTNVNEKRTEEIEREKENIENKFNELERELEIRKKELIQKQKEQQEKEEELRNEKERQSLIELWNFKYNSDEIDYDVFFSAYDEDTHKFDVDIIKTKLRGLEKWQNKKKEKGNPTIPETVSPFG